MTESMARQLILFNQVRSIEEVTEKVQNLAKQDVVRIINRLISQSAPAISLVGPSDKVMSNDKMASLLAA